jgi:phosphohistidine phosphatase
VIYLLRHGEAEQGSGDDAGRRLTAKGERQSEDAGKALARLGVKIDACLTSPKVRAADTAKLACQPLAVKPELAPALSGGEFDSGDLAAGRGDVMLVGHEPYFSDEIARLTGAKVKLRKGGLAVIDVSTLLALLRPDDLATLAASRD